MTSLVAGLATAPQTNEPARSAMLLPGFLAIARETGLPLSINEIGSSAGLNLLWDKYHYDFNGQQWGDPASIVRFSPAMRGTGFPLDVDVEIVSRRGSDIAPVAIEDEDALLRLRSFVWADQKERMERLTAAFGLAEAASLAIEKADAADWIEGILRSRKDGEAFVLFHSIVWQYLPHRTKRRIESMFEREGSLATSVAPIAWLRMEAADKEHAALSLTCWPAGITRQLANVSYHGGWIEWLI